MLQWGRRWISSAVRAALRVAATCAGAPEAHGRAGSPEELGRASALELHSLWEHAFRRAAWGMSFATADNRIIAVNQAFAEMHGGAPEEWVGRPLADMFAPEDRARLPERARLVNERGHISYESLHVRKDGSTFPVLTEVSAIKDERGVVQFRVANFQDITERRRAERELELERLRLRRLLDGAPFAAVIYEGPEHVAVLSNAAHDAMVSGRVLLGQPLLESMPELRGQLVYQRLQESYRTGKPCTLRELPVELARGGVLRPYWFDLSWQPVQDLDGAVSAVVVTAIEVTEHVEARERVQAASTMAEAAHQLLGASERRLAAMFEHAAFAVCLLEMPGGTFIDVNPAWERLFGYSRAEALGRTSAELGIITEAARSPLLREIRERGLVRQRELHVHDRAGRELIVSNNVDVIELDGSPHALLSVQDVTQQRQAEQALREALELRDEFLSIASHELRTPLTALQLQINSIERILGRQGGLPAIARQLDTAHRQIGRLERLVSELLDVSRISRGRLVVEREELELGAIAREVAERHGPAAAAAGCHITVEAEEVRGAWDRLRIEQVVTNLISNALKYGAGQPIEIRVARRGDQAVLVVQDHGPGVRPEDRERIFGRFERAVSSRNYGGLGLGLYISRQIAVAHGGSIDLTSESGGAGPDRPRAGAAFTVTLPLRPPALDREARPEPG